MIASLLATKTGKRLVRFFIQLSTAVKSHQKIEVKDYKFNSFCIYSFYLMAKTAAVNCNQGIEMALIGDTRNFPVKNEHAKLSFSSINCRYE